MAPYPVYAPLKDHQRGGRGGARSWLVILLLVAGLASAGFNVYQYERYQALQTAAVDMVLEAFKQREEAPAEPEPFTLDPDAACALSWNVCEKIL